MSLDRRQFLVSAGSLAAAAGTLLSPAEASAAPSFDATVPDSPALPAGLDEFPLLGEQVYFNSAATHPFHARVARAMKGYIDYRLLGPGEDRSAFDEAKQATVKERFAKLINARPSEIAFIQNTSDGENLVIEGMGLTAGRGNIVIDDLHFIGSRYLYRKLEERGFEIRVVRHRDGAIDVRDMERLVDRQTRLVALALVSNINGYLHDARSVTALAHAHGALVYADIIQAVGAVPLDIGALGIDAAACATYKWLMGDFGLGFLYIREDLQETAIKVTHFGHRQYARANLRDATFEERTGAARYETGSISTIGAAAVHESLQYLEALGVERIQAHARPLVARLQKELPALGYPSLTPAGTPTPILAVSVKDPADTAARLKAARVSLSLYPDVNRMRIGVSVFNTSAHVDALLDALD